MRDMVKPSFIPPSDIRQLRDLVHYHGKLTNCLTISNPALDDALSDVFGK